MKAMVLAAGLGTRLRPLTDTRPKALVEVGGRTLLEITLSRLRSFGIREVIVNVHHFADAIVDYLRANSGFGLRVEVSREEVLLDTGGGLKKAGWFFADSPEPFVLHNVDVLTNIDLAQMLQSHTNTGALATLAVMQRQTSRYLLFGDTGGLCGRRLRDHTELVRQCSTAEPLAFGGVHIISPGLLSMLTESGTFSIVEAYLRLVSGGEKIQPFRCDQYYWRDLGRIESIQQAEQDLHQNIF